ncbi:hypothetical protein NO1_1286 [Candidatus Termititenax aidoneus]|uniref:Uncharacterized protein n=1 Tax=Termititenax aidoneus TaxID=2218524 RepID=A0A388TBT9_TERA1|nr:hypothetical protein NO1_1286 [Candidatus Termititenax aidoneus]
MKKLWGIIKNVLTALGMFTLAAVAVILGLEKGEKNAKAKPLDDVQAGTIGDWLYDKYRKRDSVGNIYED